MINGQDGLNKAKTEKFDLIILDVLMPKMNGNVMAVALRRGPVAKDIPIIFLTCLVKKGDERALEFSRGDKRNFF